MKNPINRYLINSPMLPTLKTDKDGGVTIYIQAESPGAEKEANWLPGPARTVHDGDALLLAATRVAEGAVEIAPGRAQQVSGRC